MLGGLIMCHGDDFGLVLPPALAPVQAVVVVVKESDGASPGPPQPLPANSAQAACERDWTTTSLRFRLARHRVGLAGRAHPRGIGPRDVAENAALLYRRDTREKSAVSLDAS